MTLRDEIKTIKNLISCAEYSIIIYDGHFDPRLFQHIDVVQNIMYAVRKGVCIEVICDKTAKIVDDRINILAGKGKIQIHRQEMDTGFLKRLYSDNHIEKGHYFVVDSIHSRTELPHNLESEILRSDLRLKDEDFANRLKKDFRRRIYPA